MSNHHRPVPAAVARPVWPLIHGSPRPVIVIATHPAAIIARVDPLPESPLSDRPVSEKWDSGMTSCPAIALLTREASGVPNGIRTSFRAADRPFAAIAAGQSGRLGDGALELGALSFRAGRAVAVDAPRIRPSDRGIALLADAAAASPRGVADDPVDALRDALWFPEIADLTMAARALVGRGTGSTPGGDDVLCGTMAGLHATGRAATAASIAAAVTRDAHDRTTLLSASLLRLAAAGQVCTEARAVLRALEPQALESRALRSRALDDSHDVGSHDAGSHDAGSHSRIDAAISGLTRIGHTSGADLATGLVIGLRVGMAAPQRPDGAVANDVATARRQRQPIG